MLSGLFQKYLSPFISKAASNDKIWLITNKPSRYTLIGNFRFRMDRLTFFSQRVYEYQPNTPASVNALETSCYLYDFALLEPKVQELRALNNNFEKDRSGGFLTSIWRSIADSKYRNRKDLPDFLQEHEVNIKNVYNNALKLLANDQDLPVAVATNLLYSCQVLKLELQATHLERLANLFRDKIDFVNSEGYAEGVWALSQYKFGDKNFWQPILSKKVSQISSFQSVQQSAFNPNKFLKGNQEVDEGKDALLKKGLESLKYLQ